MAGSWLLGKLSGIDIRIHWTFLLVPIWVFFSSVAGGSGAVAAMMAVSFILAIFGCVLLHELGHALAARRFGIETQDITLLPIGGLASLKRIPRNPWQELVIAVAGPAVNVVIAMAIFSGLLLFSPAAGTLSTFALQLAMVNIGLVLFNMLPAFPMDGGRVLRSILAMNLPYIKATRIAATVGQVTAFGFGMLGLFGGNLMLVLIAGFIFLAARGEAVRAEMPEFLDSQYMDVGAGQTIEPVKQSRSMPILSDIRSMPVISAQWNAGNALGWLRKDSVEEFLVSSGGKIIGVIRKSDLQRAVQNGRGRMAIELLLAYGIIPIHSFYSS